MLCDPATSWRQLTRLLASAAAVLLLASACAARCPDAAPRIMTWPAYADLRARGGHPDWPYVLRIDAERGALLYFGAAHTFDPASPQVAQIEREWQAFSPDIAFNEGGLPPVASTRDEAVRTGGESGFVRFLAARDDVPTTTLDPSRAQEVAALARRFSREQIKLFFILRSVSQYVERLGTSGLSSEVERVLRVFGSTPGLGGSPRTVGEVSAAYARHFPGSGGGYEDVPSSWFDPVMSGTFLNEISRASNNYRDEYMMRLIVQHVGHGQRVFAVVGGSHVIMQEAALRGRLRTCKR